VFNNKYLVTYLLTDMPAIDVVNTLLCKQ